MRGEMEERGLSDWWITSMFLFCFLTIGMLTWKTSNHAHGLETGVAECVEETK